MIDIRLVGSNIANREELFAVLNPQLKSIAEQSIGEVSEIGTTLDALYDVLTDAAEDIVLTIEDADEIFCDDRNYYDRFMKMLRAAVGQNDKIKYKVMSTKAAGNEKTNTESDERDLLKTTEKGYAKINLTLDVTGRLENGYHLVKMIMASVGLYDELTFTKSDEPGIRLAMKTDGGEAQTKLSQQTLSMGEDNLIVKAARAILTEERMAAKGISSANLGLDIILDKNIPMAAGMAGGSADAAATLRAINRMFELGLDTEELCEIGVKLGADVPFCVRQGCYLSEGIGEVLTELPSLKDTFDGGAFIGLIKPPIDVSTKFVYEHLDTEGVEIHPDVDGQIEAIRNGSLNDMASLMRNVLRDVTVPAYPIVLELENFLKENGAINAMMSGSGPTVYGIFDDADKCNHAIEMAKITYPEMYAGVTEFI